MKNLATPKKKPKKTSQAPSLPSTSPKILRWQTSAKAANNVYDEEFAEFDELEIEKELYGGIRVCTCDEDPNWCQLHGGWE